MSPSLEQWVTGNLMWKKTHFFWQKLRFTNDILFLKLSKTVHGARRTVVHKPLGEEGGPPPIPTRSSYRVSNQGSKTCGILPISREYSDPQSVAIWQHIWLSVLPDRCHNMATLLAFGIDSKQKNNNSGEIRKVRSVAISLPYYGNTPGLRD